jgi:hypothetical protein
MVDIRGTDRQMEAVAAKAMSMPDRVLLLVAALLAAYQIVFGIEGAAPVAIWSYTIAFGVLLVAALLLIIFGFEALASPLVAIAATLIPVTLSLGLVWEYVHGWRQPYLVFAVAGFAAVAVARLVAPGRLATATLALVHGVAGLIIVALPIYLAASGVLPAGFALVGAGGALIGLAGVLLSFLKAGRPLLAEDTILGVLPSLLVLVTGAFVAGFAWL